MIITSNRTREIHDALKRRCFYHWVDYPTAERELQIIRVRLPGVEDRLSRQIVAFVQELRRRDLFKLPGVAETLDWTRALTTLDTLELSPAIINDTLGTLLKYQDDIIKMQGSEAAKLLGGSNGNWKGSLGAPGGGQRGRRRAGRARGPNRNRPSASGDRT